MLRCNGWVRLAVRLYLCDFCETAERAIWMEPRSHLTRLRARCYHIGRSLPAHRPVARSFWTSAHHSSLHGSLLLRDHFVVTVALRCMAVLRDLHRAGSGGKRCSASGLLAIYLHLVSAAIGRGTCLCNGWSGPGRHDSACGRASNHQPIWLEGSLPFSRLYCLATWTPAQLALHRRTRRGSIWCC